MRKLRDWATTTGKPTLSVCVITYNHSQYIAECINSLLDQQVSFPVEVIVGEDASTDGTGEIVSDLAGSYPGIIRAQVRSKNVGGVRNYFETHEQARGLFVAHLDGDDVAFPGKLETQVQLLRAHPEVSMSTHAVVSTRTGHPVPIPPAVPEFGGAVDLLTFGAYFVHSSVMYRAKNRYPTEFHDSITDYEVSMAHAVLGEIHLDRTPRGMYRVHGEGLSSDRSHTVVVDWGYDRAFSLAEESGIDPAAVAKGRLRFERSRALGHLIADDREQFRQRISIAPEHRGFATRRHLTEQTISRSRIATDAYRFLLKTRWGY